jgi:hypothetical protein
MKALPALAIFFALATAAAATPSPFEPKLPVQITDDSALYLGPSGATLEADYFGIPRPTIGAMRVFPCRLRLQPVVQDSRFAQICD